MKLRILQVYRIFPALFGGISTVVYSITRELCKKNDVTIFTTDVYLNGKSIDKYRWGIVEPKVYYFPVLFRASVGSNITVCGFKFVYCVKKMIRNFDVIHLHGYRTFQNIIVHHYAKRNNIPYVFQAHGTLPRVIPWRRLKWFYDTIFGYQLLRDASKVIALSRVEAEQYRSMGVPKDKIAIIPNGIDLSEYAELPPKGVFKKKFNIPEDKKIILYLGRIHITKGIDFLVRAYAYLINEMHFKDAVLVIAGPDDGYLKEVRELTDRLGVSKRVLFTGPLYGRDKLEAYVDSEFYVLPSRYETFPMTILEAYACGKPVIASNIGGLRELVDDGKTGLLIDVGDVDQLAKAILSLLNNEMDIEEMGSIGRQYVKSNFSIEKVVEKLEKVYEEVVEG